MRIPTKKLLSPFFMLILLCAQKKKTCKVLIYRDFLCFAILSSGETGIRTPDTLLGYTRFPGVPLQPLEHLSFSGRKSRGSFWIYQMFCANNQSENILYSNITSKKQKKASIIKNNYYFCTTTYV